MPRNVYWELFYHLIWRTKESAPMLRGRVEELTHKYLIHRALKTPEALVHAVGGTDDHIHMAVSLPPTIEIAKWVGDIKGSSSHEINHGPSGRHALASQVGYGVVSFGKKDLVWVVQYVQDQREHHACGRVEERLERITEIEAPQGEQPVEAR
jgi:putative transposase